jgi:hypothetical protein
MKTVRWEYRTISITYDRRTQKDWVAEHPDRPPLVGLEAVLEAYGSRGWELTSLNLERLQAVAGFGGWHVEPRAYRATFRRPVGDAA